jgi:hypothetical protein
MKTTHENWNKKVKIKSNDKSILTFKRELLNKEIQQ